MNPYSDFSVRTQQQLATDLPGLGYTPLEVRKGIWKPVDLLPFERYLVFVAPPTSNPWTERRISTKELAFLLTAQIFLLVKNYDETLSVYGDTPPNLGVFQLLNDVKNVLRATDLGGLVDRTYNETAGGSSFETGAAGGFDSQRHGWVHRAALTYTVQTQAFCFP